MEDVVGGYAESIFWGEILGLGHNPFLRLKCPLSFSTPKRL